jgi:uncharacterized membrane protein YqjE
MAEEAARSHNPAGRAGLLDTVLALASALAGFFENRFALVARDSKAALVHILMLVAFFGAALLLCAFGYVFLLLSAVFGVARLLQVSWLWTALAVAIFHFAIALVCVLLARERLRKPLFRTTAAELTKDREWLKNLGRTTRPNS